MLRSEVIILNEQLQELELELLAGLGSSKVENVQTLENSVPETGASNLSADGPTELLPPCILNKLTAVLEGDGGHLYSSIQSQVQNGFPKREPASMLRVFAKFSTSSINKSSDLRDCMGRFLAIRPNDVRWTLMRKDVFRAIAEFKMELSKTELNDLIKEFGDTAEAGLDCKQFLRLVQKQTPLEDWTRSIPISQLLADAIPRKEGITPLRAASELSEREIEIISYAMLQGIQKMLMHHVALLKKTFSAMTTRSSDITQNNLSKYVVHEMSAGSINNFHAGLKDRIGVPHLDLMKAMESEHCKKAGHDEAFHTTNYDITTTPEKEWGYAVVGNDVPQKDMVHGRKISKISDLMNLDLTKKAGLCKEETISLVLYTSPMYLIYNSILRRFPRDIFERFKKGSNLYSTSIHVLVSAVTRLCRCLKLPSNLVLYRGLGGLMELPPTFFREDEFGIKGFAEWGFMSTTSEKRIALHYSGVKEGKPCAMVLVIHPGAVDRGACIKEFSQFPAEIEYLWLPLSYIEAAGPQYLEICNEGLVTMVPVRVNANHKTSTVDDLVGRKKEIHVSAFQFLIDELRIELTEMGESKEAAERLIRDVKATTSTRKGIECSVMSLIEKIMQECEAILSRHKATNALTYTSDEVFRGLVTEMLQVKGMAKSKLIWWLSSEHDINYVLHRPLRRAHRERIMIMERQLATRGRENSDRISRLEEELARAKQESVEFTTTNAKDLCLLKGLMQDSVNNLNEMEENAIQRAAAEGEKVSHLRLLIHAAADISCKDKENRTLVMLAAQNGHPETVKALVDLKASVNDRTPGEYTAILYAAERGHTETVRALVDAGADTESMSNALESACDRGHSDTVKALIELSCDVNSRGWRGWTMLMLATSKGRTETVKNLIECGAEITASSPNGLTAIMLGARSGHTNTIKTLVALRGDVNFVPGGGKKQVWTPIMWAAQNGHLETVKALKDLGAQVNASNQIPLIDSIRIEYAPYFQSRYPEEKSWPEYLEQGAQREVRDLFGENSKVERLIIVNALTKVGLTALMLASQIGMTEIVEALVANVNAPDKDGWTALMFAAEQGHTATIQKLVRIGANVDTTRKGGGNAVMLAAENNKVDAVEALIKEHKAKVNAVKDDGTTALMIAAMSGHKDVVTMLLKLGADKEARNNEKISVVMHAAVRGHAKIIELLDADLSASDQGGRTALMYAAESGHAEAVKQLAVLGADVNTARNLNGGGTAAILAAQNGHDEVVRMLVKEYGADVNAAKDDGVTALMLAAQRGHLSTVKLLVDELEANTKAENKFGLSALQYAFDFGHSQIVKLLQARDPRLSLGSIARPPLFRADTRLGFSSLTSNTSDAIMMPNFRGQSWAANQTSPDKFGFRMANMFGMMQMKDDEDAGEEKINAGDNSKELSHPKWRENFGRCTEENDEDEASQDID